MLSPRSWKRSALKVAAATFLVSSLALGGQAGAWKNGCEHGVYYTYEYPYGLIPHAWAHCS